MKKGNKNILNIKAHTWNKESNELFDYESEDITKQIIEIKTEGVIAKKTGGILKFIQRKNDVILESKLKVLLSIDCNDENYYIKRHVINQSSQISTYMNKHDTPWLILKNLKVSTNNYKLLKGDVFKLGRIKLKIWDYKLNEEEANCESNNTKHMITKQNDKSININEINRGIANPIETKGKKKKVNTCRICYCDEFEDESPLIAPCNCSGTMKYIHFGCLQKWLKSRVVIKSSANENSISYSLKQIECELCKTLLPDFLKFKNKIYEVWDFKHGFKSFITLEYLITEKNSNRLLYVINLEKKKEIRIGRGHDSDIRVTDISVSRFHALIKRENNTFTLEDNNSKFGTLVLIQNPYLKVMQSSYLPLQVGRTCFHLTIKKPLSIFSCLCFIKKTEKNVDYQMLNAENINFENSNNIKIQQDNEEVEYESEANESVISLDIPSIKKSLSKENEHNQSEIFFKVLETKPNIYDEELVGDEIVNNIENNVNNDQPEGSHPSRLINRLEVNKNNGYFERLNTNSCFTKVELNEIREKIKNDLDSLRRINNNLEQVNNNEDIKESYRSKSELYIGNKLHNQKEIIKESDIELNLELDKQNKSMYD